MDILMCGGAGNMRCILSACARYVAVGLSQSAADHDMYPVVSVLFDPHELQIIAPLLGAMMRTNTPPVVHIWNERNGAPEVVVIFRILNPEPELLGEICGSPFDLIAQVISDTPCTEVLTMGEATVPYVGVEAFISRYADTRQAFVVVSDASTLDEDGVECLQTFPITSFERCPPVFV